MNELSDQVLRNIFVEIAHGSSFENKDIEFKESFGWVSMAMYFKTMAGFANARGGYLIFGVRDGAGCPVGLHQEALKRFKNIDGKEWSTNLSSHFHGEIEWDRKIFPYQNKFFAVIYTAPAKKRPIICKNEVNSDLKKGAIYYRYAAQTSQIEPADLDTILEEEKRKYLNLILERVKVMMDAGPENIAVVNLLSGDFTLDSVMPVNVMIDSETLKEIQFIREGHFVDKEGAPALVLKGEIQQLVPVERVMSSPMPKSISDGDIIHVFLWQKMVDSPDEYLRQVCFFRTAYYPIYYLIRMGEKSFTDVQEFLNGIPEACVANIRSKVFKRIECLQKNNTLYKPISDHSLRIDIRPRRGTKASAACRKRRVAKMILGEKVDDVVLSLQDDNLKYFLMAVQTLSKEDVVVHQGYLFGLLQRVFDEVFLPSACDSPTRTEFRKAVCWMDEALYLMNASSGGTISNHY